MAWCTGLPTLAALLLLMLPSLVTSAPVIEQNTEMDSYYPVADSTGCYYNFEHYDEGDRIITNEPCLNCTCHNRMLMCYLRVCPFIKAIGENCKVEKRADQCCPIITCPEVPVQLLTSTTTESGATSEVGHLDTYGCSIDKLFYADGARVPSDPSKPCELCYCIRNKTACVMQECTLQIDGCAPVYQEGVCCPVRYNCEHEEDSLPETTALPTTTTTIRTIFTTLPAATPSDCLHDGQIFADGSLIKKELCDHCYCMKGDIVCAVQECGPTPLDKVNCTALPIKEGQCCPDTYDCENISEEELTTTYYELTTQASLKEVEQTKKPELTEPTQSPEINENIPTEIQEHETASPVVDNQTPELPQERKPIVHPEEAITSAEQTTDAIEKDSTQPQQLQEDISEETVTQKEVPIKTDQVTQQPEIVNTASISDEATLSNEIDQEEGELVHKKEDEQPHEATEETVAPITAIDQESEKEITTAKSSEAQEETAQEILKEPEVTSEESNEILPQEISTEEIKPSEFTPGTIKAEEAEGTEPVQNIQTELPALSPVEQTDLTTEKQENLQRTAVPSKLESSQTTIASQEEGEKEEVPLSPETENLPHEPESTSIEDKEAHVPEPVTEQEQDGLKKETSEEGLEDSPVTQKSEDAVTAVTLPEEKIIEPAAPETTELPVEYETPKLPIGEEKVEESITEVETERPEEVVTEVEKETTEKKQPEDSIEDIPAPTEKNEPEISNEDSQELPASTEKEEKEKPESSELDTAERITVSLIQSATEGIPSEIPESNDKEIETTEPTESQDVSEIENQTNKVLPEQEASPEETPEVLVAEEEKPHKHPLEVENELESHTVAEDVEHDGDEDEDLETGEEEEKEVEKPEHERPQETDADGEFTAPEKEEETEQQPMTPISEDHSEEVEAITEIIPSKAPELPESQVKIHEEKETTPEAVTEQKYIPDEKLESVIPESPETSETPVEATQAPPQDELSPHDVESGIPETTEEKGAPESSATSEEEPEEHHEITEPSIIKGELPTAEVPEKVTEQEPETPIDISKTSETSATPSETVESQPALDVTPETPDEHSTESHTVVKEQEPEVPMFNTEIPESPTEAEEIVKLSESPTESSEHPVQTSELPEERPEKEPSEASVESTEVQVDTTEASEEPSENVLVTEAPMEAEKAPQETSQSAESETSTTPVAISTSLKETSEVQVETSESSMIATDKIEETEKSPETTEEALIAAQDAEISTETESPVKTLETLPPTTKSPIEIPIVSEETLPTHTELSEGTVVTQSPISEISKDTSESETETPQESLETTSPVLKAEETTIKLSGPEEETTEKLLSPEIPVEVSKQTTVKSVETSESSESPINVSETIPESPSKTIAPIEIEFTEEPKLPEEIPAITEITQKPHQMVSEETSEEIEIITDVPQPTSKPIESFDHVTELEPSVPEKKPEHEEIPVIVPEIQPCPAGAICDEPQTGVDPSKELCNSTDDCKTSQENIPQICLDGQECKEQIPESTEIPSPQSETEVKPILQQAPDIVEIPCKEGENCKESLPVERPVDMDTEHEYEEATPSAPSVDEKEKGQAETESPLPAEHQTIKHEPEENEIEQESITTARAETQTLKSDIELESATPQPVEEIIPVQTEETIQPESPVQHEPETTEITKDEGEKAPSDTAEKKPEVSPIEEEIASPVEETTIGQEVEQEPGEPVKSEISTKAETESTSEKAESELEQTAVTQTEAEALPEITTDLWHTEPHTDLPPKTEEQEPQVQTELPEPVTVDATLTDETKEAEISPTDSNKVLPQSETEAPVEQVSPTEKEIQTQVVSKEEIKPACDEKECKFENVTPLEGENKDEKMPTPSTEDELKVTEDVDDNIIPGEGNCLVDGQTYENNSSVPPISRCQISCKCISSILQCESVSCSPAPSNLENCMPIYHSPDSCCPTYSCTMPGVSTIESDNQLLEITTKAINQEQVTEASGVQEPEAPYSEEPHREPIEEEPVAEQTETPYDSHSKPTVTEEAELPTETPHVEPEIKPEDEPTAIEKEEEPYPEKELPTITEKEELPADILKTEQQVTTATEKEEIEPTPEIGPSAVTEREELPAEILKTEEQVATVTEKEEIEPSPENEPPAVTEKEKLPAEILKTEEQVATATEKEEIESSPENELPTVTEKEELPAEILKTEEQVATATEKEELSPENEPPTVTEKEELPAEIPKPEENGPTATEKEELSPENEPPTVTEKEELPAEVLKQEEVPTATEEQRPSQEAQTHAPHGEQTEIKPLEEKPATTEKVELETESPHTEEPHREPFEKEQTITEKIEEPSTDVNQTETPISEQSHTEAEQTATEKEQQPTDASHSEESHIKPPEEELTETLEIQQTESPHSEQPSLKPVEEEPTSTDKEETLYGEPIVTEKETFSPEVSTTEIPYLKPTKEEPTSTEKEAPHGEAVVTEKEKSSPEVTETEVPHLKPVEEATEKKVLPTETPLEEEPTASEKEEEPLYTPVETEYAPDEEEADLEEQTPEKDPHEEVSGQAHEITTKSKPDEAEPTRPPAVVEEITKAIEEHPTSPTITKEELPTEVTTGENEQPQEYTPQEAIATTEAEAVETDNEVSKPSESPEDLVPTTETVISETVKTITVEEPKKETAEELVTTTLEEVSTEAQKEAAPEIPLVTEKVESVTVTEKSVIEDHKAEEPVSTEIPVEKLVPAVTETIEPDKQETPPSEVESGTKQPKVEISTETIKAETEQEELEQIHIAIGSTSTENELHKPTEGPKEVEQGTEADIPKIETEAPDQQTITEKSVSEVPENENVEPIAPESDTASPELSQEKVKTPEVEAEKSEHPEIVTSSEEQEKTESPLPETSVPEIVKQPHEVIENESEKPISETETQKSETEQDIPATETQETQTEKSLPEVTEKLETVEPVVHITEVSKEIVTSASHVTEGIAVSESTFSEDNVPEQIVTEGIIPVTETQRVDVEKPVQTEELHKEPVATSESVQMTEATVKESTPEEPVKEISEQTQTEQTEEEHSPQPVRTDESAKEPESTSMPEINTEVPEIQTEKATEKSEVLPSEEASSQSVEPAIEVTTQSILKPDLYTSPPELVRTTYKTIIPGELQTSAPLVPSDLEPLLTTLAPHYHVTSTTYAPNYEITQPTKLPEPAHEHLPEAYPPQTDEDYDVEEPAFGPGTCRYGGKVYVSAQQIPRDDPCDFCFCFRSDIICLQQSCPPPIPRCHEEPIRGFCCPRYECPVNMATSVNITTTTTTTTTTLPPHFLAHAYRGQANKNGCLIQGQAYKVGEVIRSASGPCLHCVCGGDGQMQCDPKVCSPEPMLRQMMEATIASRR